MVATGNQNKCPPENQHFFLTALRSANAMKIKVYHTGAVRNASQPEEKTFQQLCMEESKKKLPPFKPKIFNVNEKLELS